MRATLRWSVTNFGEFCIGNGQNKELNEDEEEVEVGEGDQRWWVLGPIPIEGFTLSMPSRAICICINICKCICICIFMCIFLWPLTNDGEFRSNPNRRVHFVNARQDRHDLRLGWKIHHISSLQSWFPVLPTQDFFFKVQSWFPVLPTQDFFFKNPELILCFTNCRFFRPTKISIVHPDQTLGHLFSTRHLIAKNCKDARFCILNMKCVSFFGNENF